MNQIIVNDEGHKFVLSATTLRQVKYAEDHNPYTMSLKDVDIKAGTTQYRILWTPDILAQSSIYDRKKKYPTDFTVQKNFEGKFTHLEIGCQFFKGANGRAILRAVRVAQTKTSKKATKIGTFAKTKKAVAVAA